MPKYQLVRRHFWDVLGSQEFEDEGIPRVPENVQASIVAEFTEAGRAFIRPTIINAIPISAFGNPANFSGGQFLVDIFCPAGSGPDEAYRIGDILDRYFTGKLFTNPVYGQGVDSETTYRIRINRPISQQAAFRNNDFFASWPAELRNGAYMAFNGNDGISFASAATGVEATAGSLSTRFYRGSQGFDVPNVLGFPLLQSARVFIDSENTPGISSAQRVPVETSGAGIGRVVINRYTHNFMFLDPSYQYEGNGDGYETTLRLLTPGSTQMIASYGQTQTGPSTLVSLGQDRDNPSLYRFTYTINFNHYGG